MDNFPEFNPRNPQEAGLDVPDKEQFLAKLAEMLKENKGFELIGTFQAGCIPVILDTLARDTSEDGRDIVIAIYKLITDLKTYYAKREKELVEEEEEEEVQIPVEKPE